jgi:hypothetical protein
MMLTALLIHLNPLKRCVVLPTELVIEMIFAQEIARFALLIRSNLPHFVAVLLVDLVMWKNFALVMAHLVLLMLFAHHLLFAVSLLVSAIPKKLAMVTLLTALPTSF